MNHQPKARANARFAYERSSEGMEIRVYSTKLILVGQEVYIFYGNKTPDTWVGLVIAVFPDVRQITVEWMCAAKSVAHTDPYRENRCPNEMFLTSHTDQIEVDTVDDIAEIEFHHDGRHTNTLCWRQLYNPDNGQFVPERLLVPACRNARTTFSTPVTQENRAVEQAPTLGSEGQRVVGITDRVSRLRNGDRANGQDEIHNMPLTARILKLAGFVRSAQSRGVAAVRHSTSRKRASDTSKSVKVYVSPLARPMPSSSGAVTPDILWLLQG
ncbi:hypothetical protein H2200_007531 [Cladophialophora chaetospira]|uniref:BAH domain-containing protein n=1 Tax=Cladophialophora chaetospira TaxID=386627 RepID=A0AA38X8K2_9EURO|nr:hypothetical protein H2200_007531 [Cladophialophora chaetospira]